MKENLHSLLTTLYGYIVALAVLAGAIVAVLFVVAFLLSGDTATSISAFNLAVMNLSKKLACYAILIGLVDFYLIKEHHLCIDQSDKDEETEAETAVTAST